MHVVRASVLAFLFFIWMVTVSLFIEYLFTMSWNPYYRGVMEMMFEVWSLDRLTDRYVSNSCLIMHKNKGINCHLLCRAVKNEAGLLYCISCFYTFFDDQEEEKLSVLYSFQAEEGTMSRWCKLSSVPLSFCVCLSLYLISLIALTCTVFCNSFCISKPYLTWIMSLLQESLYKIILRTYAVKHRWKLKMMNRILNYVN